METNAAYEAMGGIRPLRGPPAEIGKGETNEKLACPVDVAHRGCG